jgi:hypothetical protein
MQHNAVTAATQLREELTAVDFFFLICGTRETLREAPETIDHLKNGFGKGSA